jgi:chromosome segregation ATPase
MTTGSDVHDKIKGKVRELESEDSKVNREVESCRSEIERLAQQRDECYSKLAEFYLPALEAENVRQTIREVRGEIQQIFNKRQERKQFLEREMANCTDRRHQLEEELDKNASQLIEVENDRDATRKKISEDLLANAEYTQTDKQARQAQERLNQNKNRAETFGREAKTKISSFESNPWFMYLVNRNYGTENQVGYGLTRILDDFVARGVNFTKNKQNYDFLRSMPEIIQKEVATQQEELNKVVAELRKTESAVEKKYGLPMTLQQHTLLSKTKTDLLGSIERIEAEYESNRAKREELSKTRNEGHYNEAKERLEKFLQGLSIDELRSRASETLGKDDDIIVEKLESINSTFVRVKNKMNSLRAKRTETSNALEKARRIETKFRAEDYDSSRSRFEDDFDIKPLLTGYILGRISEGEVFRRVEDNHHLKPVETYHSSYDYTPTKIDSGGNIFGGGGDTGGVFDSGLTDSGGSFSSGDSG